MSKLWTKKQRKLFENGLCPVCGVPYEYSYTIDGMLLEGYSYKFQERDRVILPCGHSVLDVIIID